MLQDKMLAVMDEVNLEVAERGELVRLYGMLTQMGADATEQNSALIAAAIGSLEAMSKQAHDNVGFTYAPLGELERLQ